MSAADAVTAGRIIPAEAIAAAGLLQYQGGAVVSRTLLKHPTASVTVFAFDTGQGLSEHASPFDALVFMLEGKAEIHIAGKPVPAKSGDLLWIPANRPHGLKATTPFKMILTMMRG
jgi:quercetin dioxygenase-like cupin family protein